MQEEGTRTRTEPGLQQRLLLQSLAVTPSLRLPGHGSLTAVLSLGHGLRLSVLR